MRNYIGLAVFVIIAFCAGLSLAFKIMDIVLGERKLFANIKTSLITYFCGVIAAFCFTGISIWAVIRLQNIIH